MDWWDRQIESEAVVVRVAQPEMRLGMKLLAGRECRDSGDIACLHNICGVTTLSEATYVFGEYYLCGVIAEPGHQQLRERCDPPQRSGRNHS
jgi:hypothetical protein